MFLSDIQGQCKMIHHQHLTSVKHYNIYSERQRGAKRLAKGALHVTGVIHCLDSPCTYRGRDAFHHAR